MYLFSEKKKNLLDKITLVNFLQSKVAENREVETVAEKLNYSGINYAINY